MKNSFTLLPLYVAGVCMAVLVMTAEAVQIHHPKFKQVNSDVIPGRYIVRFNNDASDSAGSLFAQSMHEVKGAHFKVHQHYKHDFFNGISVTLDTDDAKIKKSALETLLDRSDVSYISPVRVVPRPVVKLTKKGKDTKSILPHGMTQVDLVHSKLKNKGKGVLVGVLDSGIDYKLPALGGGFGKGFKVSAGYDLVGDKYTGANAPTPDSDPLDECGAGSGASGHGTHVSGIIAGFDPSTNFTGVAPEANLAMYRVFGCSGNTGDDIIIKGLLMAYDAGADVINLSLGSTNPWVDSASNSEIAVVNQIVAKGVHVIISAGNAGAQGAYTIGSPSTATGAFSIASVQNMYTNTTTLIASGFKDRIPYVVSSGFSTDAKLASGDLAVAAKSADPANDACNAADVSADVKGKIALIKRGACSFTVKANNAAAAGATAAIFYDNVDEALAGASAPDSKIASVMVNLADGNAFIAALKKGKVSINFDAGKSVIAVTDGGCVSGFSSVGPSAELIPKPNIAGPGGRIYSTLPRYLGSWGLMDGTSMSSPYVAGSMALYVKAHGKKKNKVQFVNEHFQNYASPRPVFKSDATDSPARAGAGLLQVYDAITQTTHITPAQISFNDTATNNYRKQTFTITNHGSKTVKYELGNLVSTGIAPYDTKQGYTPLEPARNVQAKANLRFSTKTLTLAPGKSKKVTVTVTPPKTDPKEHIYYGGYITISSKTSRSLKIPYIGVQGKQVELPLFDKGYPYIGSATQSYGSNDTYTYDRNKPNTAPFTVYRLLTPTRQMKAELIDSNNKVLGLYQEGTNFLSRNFLSDKTFVSGFKWDGTYFPPSFSVAIPAPSGTYRFKISALKLFGNPKNPKHWEVFTSGPVVLQN
ncbi:peptidase S8/S53 domain-containing protein [Sporodiniella umbellata]|nr:peptidase S8/S53 domain-containing protein [Sporodiniella umbellata]